MQYAVRLDLIRPLSAPAPALDGEAARLAEEVARAAGVPAAPALRKALADADAKAEAAAQAREAVKPVGQ